MAMTQAQKERAKRYRENLMAAAKAGGYTPQRRQGTGKSIKKVSKSGTTYYYTPWKELSRDEKEKRLAYARESAARTRAEARAYRAEHGM